MERGGWRWVGAGPLVQWVDPFLCLMFGAEGGWYLVRGARAGSRVLSFVRVISSVLCRALALRHEPRLVVACCFAVEILRLASGLVRGHGLSVRCYGGNLSVSVTVYN